MKQRAARQRAIAFDTANLTYSFSEKLLQVLKNQVVASSQAVRQRRADYFYVFAEAVAVTIIDCYPTTASSVLLLSKQALQHCFNSRARQVSTRAIVAHLHFRRLFQVFDGHAASSQAFRRRRASRPRCRQQPSCSTTKRHEAESASDLKVQVATSSQAIRQRRADYFYVFAEPSPSPSLIAIRRQHRPFCYSRSKLFNTASTQKCAKFQQSYCCAFAFLKTVSGFNGHAASSQAFRRRRASRLRRHQQPCCSTTVIQAKSYEKKKKQELMAEQPI